MPYTCNDEETLPMNYQAKAQHTPGPWSAGWTSDRYTVKTSDNQQTIASVFDGLGKSVGCGSANARLIAAAPELLEALRTLTALVNGARVTPAKREQYLDQARAAIAKATGQV